MQYSRQNTKFTHQERLAKEDIRLLLTALSNVDWGMLDCSYDRLQMLIEKLKRMEKQK